MNSIKLFFASTIFGLACLNVIAMEDPETVNTTITETPAGLDAEAARILGSLDLHAPATTGPAVPARATTASTHTPATINTASTAPATQAEVAPIDPIAKLRELKTELTNTHRYLYDLIKYFNYNLQTPTHFTPETIINTVHTGLTETSNSIRQLLAQYNERTSTAGIGENNAALQEIIAQIEQLRNNIKMLLNTINPIADNHRAQLNSAQQTLNTLHNHFARYAQQKEVEGNEQTPLNSADRNLAQEISAFFLYSGNKLQTVRQSIDTAKEEITQLSRELWELQVEPLEQSKHIEGLVLNARQAQEQEVTEAASQTTNQGYASRIWATTKRVGQVAGNLLKQATTTSNLFLTTMLPYMPSPSEIPQKLRNTQETIDRLLIRLDETKQKLQDASATEYEIINNVKKLCLILNDDRKPEDNKMPQFHLYKQEEIERSLLTTILSSELRTQLLQIPLLHEQQNAAPATSISAIPYVDRLVPYVTEWMRRQTVQTIDPTGILAPTTTTHQEEAGADKKFSLDDHYTRLLIRTQNPNFLLYDIAARTRFNTGRFSYLIKPFIHELETTLEGPLKYVDNNPDDNELEKLGFHELKGHAERYWIPHRGHVEQPGERYSTFMRSLADTSTPLEHPWLLFFKPMPWIVYGIEKILSTADPKLATAQKKVTTSDSSNEPFTSTSLSGFVWGGLKKMVGLPTRAIGTALGKALTNCTNWITDKARIISEPFIQTGPVTKITTKLAEIKNKTASIVNTVKIKSAQAFRWVSCLFMRKTIDNLELNMREGHPASEGIFRLQNLVSRYKIEGLTETIKAFIANNHQQIRAFAQKYKTIQHIEPIVPLDPITQMAVPQEATIKDVRLRNELGNLIYGWGR